MSGISFQAENAKGKAVIYISNDGSINQLTLTLTNTTGSPLGLKSCAAVPEGQITSAGPTSLYITFGGLLTKDQFKNLQVTAQGWNVEYFEGDVTNWALTPSTDGTLANNTSIEIVITNIEASGQPRPGNITVDYYNLSGTEDDSEQATVFLQNAPTGPNELQLNYGFVNENNVYVTQDAENPIENTLIFYLTNPSPTDPIVPQGTPWGPNPPVFNVSFVYGEWPGPGALCTAQSAADTPIVIGIQEEYADRWQPQPETEGENPYWQLMPQQHEVLGVGKNATVEFNVSQIISQLVPGLTLMYIQYANIPGYNDGYFSLEISKLDGPVIDSFYAVPDIVPYFSETTGTTLWWQSQNARYVTFDEAVSGSQQFALSGSGPFNEPLQVSGGQLITMTAHLTDSEGNDVATVSKKIRMRNLARTDVQVSVDQLGAIALPPGSGNVYPVQNDYDDNHLVAVVNRSDNRLLNPIDIDYAIQPYKEYDNNIIASCSSPHGAAIYLVVETGANEARTTIPSYVLLAVNTSDNSVKQVMEIGQLTENLSESVFSAALTISPDGRRLFLTVVLIITNNPADKNPGGLWVIDALRYQVEYKYPLPLDLRLAVFQPIFFPGSQDGSKVYHPGFAVFDLTNNFSVVSILKLYEQEGLITLGMAAASSDFKRLYTIGSKDLNTSDITLVVADIDPASFKISIAQMIDFNSTDNNALNTVLALSGDNKTLYASFYKDQLTVIDTSSLSYYSTPCGLNGDYQPIAMAIGAGGQTIYSVGNSWNTNSTLTVLKIS